MDVQGAKGASMTGSTVEPTQPALPHHVSLDSSRRLSSILNSSPSSSSSCRRPREAGFSSQACPTSAGRLAAVGEADVEAVSDSLGSANRQSRQQGGGGSQNELVPVRRRREVRETSRCTQAWVSFTGPVPRREREVKQEL